jgi:PAS domain S-box-containing protein
MENYPSKTTNKNAAPGIKVPGHLNSEPLRQIKFHKHSGFKKEFYRIIADFSGDWIYWVNPDSTIGFVSTSCKYFTGYESDEMTNELEFFNRILHPDDVKKFEFEMNKINQGHTISNDEFRIRTKKGETIWISHMSLAVFDRDDKYIGRYVCNKDISDMKDPKRMIVRRGDVIYQAYNDASVGYYQIFYDGRIKTANNFFVKLLGYDSLNDFEDLNFEDYCVLNIEKRMNLKHSILKHGHVKDFESEWIKKDGTLIYLRETAHTVINPDGSQTFYEGIVNDVTDQKKAEEAMRELSFEKRKTEELKTEFLAMISHEIRTPLNVILNFTQLSKSDFEDISSSELSERIDIVDREGKRIQRTIGLLLEMAELQTGTYETNMTEVSLVDEILLEIYGQYQNLSIEKNISFAFLNELANVKIIADKHGMFQIFNQLVDNAFKYTQNGQIVMKLYSDDEKQIVVEVSDTGIGIDKEYLPYLFTVFSQEDHSYSRMFEGTGLGLAIVKKHCELNGVSISVESEKHKGTKFFVKFSV